MNLCNPTKNRLPGDVVRMLEERDPDFVTKPKRQQKPTAYSKVAREKKDDQERLLQEKNELKAAGILIVSQIENGIAQEDDAAQAAFPRQKSDVTSNGKGDIEMEMNDKTPQAAKAPRQAHIDDSTGQDSETEDNEIQAIPLKRTYAVTDIDPAGTQKYVMNKPFYLAQCANAEKHRSEADKVKGIKPRPAWGVSPQDIPSSDDDRAVGSTARPHGIKTHDISGQNEAGGKTIQQTMSPPQRELVSKEMGGRSQRHALSEDSNTNSNTMESDDKEVSAARKGPKTKGKRKRSATKGKTGKVAKKAKAVAKEKGTVCNAVMESRKDGHAIDQDDRQHSKSQGGLVDGWCEQIARAQHEKLDQLKKDNYKKGRSRNDSRAPSSTASSTQKKTSSTAPVSVVSTSHPLKSDKVKQAQQLLALLKRQEQDDPPVDGSKIVYGASFGGFEDGDDGAEREAIRLSPCRGENQTPRRDLVEVTSPRLVKKISEFQQSDIPRAAQSQWRYGFVTTYVQWLASQEDPWDVRSEAALKVMQKCWDFIYGDTVPYKITGMHDVVLHQFEQQYRELRSQIAAAAVAALDEHFDNINALTNAQRKAEAQQLGGEDTIFIYGHVRPGADGTLRQNHPFQGQLIIAAFCAYLKYIKRSKEGWRKLKKTSPIGALALATVAVERAMEYWENFPIKPGTANMLAERPKSKYKSKAMVKTEPLPNPLLFAPKDNDLKDANNGGNDSQAFGQEPRASGSQKIKQASEYKLKEFNYDNWYKATCTWIPLITAHGFKNLPVMQKLLDKAGCYQPLKTLAEAAPAPPRERRVIIIEDSD